MKFSPSNKFIPSFSAGIVNINAVSDVHGELKYAGHALECMRTSDVFEKDEKGKTNVFAVVGDWFMDGGRKGYITNPDKSMQEMQGKILNLFFEGIRTLAKNTSMLFVPGNHEFDAGVEIADKAFSNIDAEILATNLDVDASERLPETKSAGNAIKEKIIEVEDDKNPELKHKVLFLGIMPVNLKFYQKNSDGLALAENIPENQTHVKRKDYEISMNLCKERINKFREENPNGAVVLLSHTGVAFADNLAKESHTDLILDGHEHLTDTRFSNAVPVVPLHMNFLKAVNAKLIFDDNGRLLPPEIKEYHPRSHKEGGMLTRVYQEMFKEDAVPIYSIRSKGDIPIESLDIEGVRLGNNHLANFVTDAVLKEIKKRNPEVDFFAVNSSSIRHSLSLSKEKTVSNFDVMNVLAGITTSDGELYKTKVKGSDLAYMVSENVVFNSNMPEKNTLIQYSGLKVNRNAMLELLNNPSNKKRTECALSRELTKYIIDKSTGKPVEPDKEYVIVNPIKYFNKSPQEQIRKMKDISEPLGYGVKEAFSSFFKNSGNEIIFTPEVRIF